MDWFVHETGHDPTCLEMVAAMVYSDRAGSRISSHLFTASDFEASTLIAHRGALVRRFRVGIAAIGAIYMPVEATKQIARLLMDISLASTILSSCFHPEFFTISA